MSVGQLIDEINDQHLGSQIYDWLHPDPLTRNAFINAQNWRPFSRDPLTLDLDGDGLETVGASVTKPILFDHDGDGTKNGTGWVKPDDGFLAMDRNGNGTIDNGSELFGDATALYAGGKAVDGFAALAQEDSNRDGKVDSADARWQQLRVWRDLNQDGLSQAGELFTLDQLGIASLNVAQVANSQILANGNQIADLGAFTWKNGRSGTMGDVGKMADINLVEDTLYRQYTDPVAVDRAVAALPEVRGSGAVRDLREAASLSPALRDILTQYAQATTRQEQRALLAPLMQAWADTSGLAGSMQERAAGQYVVSYQAIGTQTEYSPGWADTVSAWEARMHVLEAFNGRYFYGLPGQSGGTPIAAFGLSMTQPASEGAAPRIDIVVLPTQIAILDQSYAALSRSVHVALAMQTRLKPLLDKLGVEAGESGIKFDFSRLETHFKELIAHDPVNGLADLIDFNGGTREMFANTGWNGEQIMARYMTTLAPTPELLEMYSQWNVRVASSDVVFGSEGEDLILVQEAGSRVYASAGDDIVIGRSGNDYLDGGAGSDMFAAGRGDDRLFGGAGNDLYLLFRGDGIDIINDNDTTPGNTDVVQFFDVAASELTALERRGNDLILRYGVSDQVSVEGYFSPNYPGLKIEQFHFSDGVIWDKTAIKQRVMTMGSAAADRLTGYDDGPNRIYGLDGNDGLSGGARDDLLDGGDGNDRLSGGAGNDVLRGGVGDDSLAGGADSDTYLLARGDGVDMISDYDTTPGKADVARFTDVASTEVTLMERRGYNLVLRYGTADQLTVENHFHPNFPQYKVDQFQFNDGVVWNDAAIKARVMTVGTASGDSITGYNDGANRIYGLDGNDYLYGGNGDDLLCGGKGNDRLSGGAGNDIYLLTRGDGMDVINNLDTTRGKIDVAQFADVASTEVTALERREDNLVLRYGTPDQLTVERYFDSSAPAYKLERLQFSDGVVWDEAAVKQRVITVGSANGELIYGYNDGANRILGLGGNDTLYGGARDDFIDGGVGDDKLYGGSGSDVLNGGVGNDLLSGDTGNDTYLLSRGDGVDVINDYDGTPGNTDVVQFVNVASTEVTLLERRGDHLVLRYGTPDQLTIERYFDAGYPGYRVERLGFSDGVVWDEAAVKQRVMTVGTASGDGITGYSDAANRIYGLDGNDYLLGGASDDLLEGGNGNDNLSGGGGNDLLNGGNDNDTLSGGAGNDVLQGAAGADSLNDASGNNLFNGGADNDVINGGSGNELYIGGAGNDVISTGSGCDLMAFNRGDGQDVVLASSGQDNTVSLGGGIVAADLSLTKSGADLVLGTGANESITFRDWYASAGNRNVARLQMLDDAAGNDGGAASGPLENGRVAQFDFAALAGRFDQARAASPELTSWSLSSSLLDFHLGSSDSAAIGGDLAYQYARLGNLSAMSLAPAQSLLANAQFGSASQALQASAILQDLSPRLM